MSDNDNNSPYEPKDPWDRTNTEQNREDSTYIGSNDDTAEMPTVSEPDTAAETDTVSSGEQAGPEQTSGGEKPQEDTASAQNQEQQYQQQNQQGYYNPYGQYSNNPYGQYNNNPYGNYYNPYGNQQNSYFQSPYQQSPNNNQGQYWTYQQYGGQYQQQNPQPKEPKRKNTGLRVFLWILGVLVAGSVLGFSVYGVYTAIEQKNGTLPSTSSQAPQNNGGDNGKSGGANSSGGTGSASSGQQIQGAAPGNGTNPNSTGIVINSQPGGNQLPAKDVYKKVVQSVVGVETAITDATTGESGTGQGTGIIATADGYILTNAHVVNYSRSNKVTVILYDKKEYTATVVGYDKTSDIAVLKINANNLTPATFGNADQMEVGDEVIAIGNPGGMNYASSLTGGFVSALNRSIENHSDNGMTYIQTDAAINPGNSGGPLVNMYGQVVGINSNKIVATGFEGMGFAIPVSKAKTIIDDLVARGYVSGRSRLGIQVTPVTDIQSQLSGLPTGVMIRAIDADSDLKKSNVMIGDIITKVDGQKITVTDDLYAIMNKHKAGDTITLTIYSQGEGNNGVTRQVKAKLLEDKGETQAK